MKIRLCFAVASIVMGGLIASTGMGQSFGGGNSGSTNRASETALPFLAVTAPSDTLPGMTTPVAQSMPSPYFTPMNGTQSLGTTAWGFEASTRYPGAVTIYENGEFAVVDPADANEPGDQELLARQSQEGQRVLQAAMSQLKSDSASETERQEAKKILAQYLDVQFNADHERRVQQLKSLEEQVVTLKAQLEKRESSKQRLIELRLTLLENDANGLGFPSGWNVATETHWIQPALAVENFTYGQQPRFPYSTSGALPAKPTNPAPPNRRTSR